MIGYFSPKAAAYRTVIWRKPDGQEVEVTGVCDALTPSKEHYEYWTDKICVGEVTDFVRPGYESLDYQMDQRELRAMHDAELARRWDFEEESSESLICRDMVDRQGKRRFQSS